MNRKKMFTNYNLLTVVFLFFLPIQVVFASLSEDIQVGGLVVLGDTADEYDFGYLSIYVDPDNDTLQFQSFALDPETLEFFEVEFEDGDSDELILTSNGWQQNPLDYVVGEFDGNTISAMNSANENIAISGIPLNIENQTFDQLLSTLADPNESNDFNDINAFLGFYIRLDPEFTFSDSAEAYSMEFTSLSNAYFLWTTLECVNRIDSECWYTYVQNSAQQNGAITSLDDMFTASEWDGSDPAELLAVQIAGGQSANLLAEFVSSENSSGVVNYYIQNYANNTIIKMSQGQWQHELNQGTDLLLLALSDELLSAVEDLVDIDTTQLLFSVFGGYVRNGGYDLTGQSDDELEIWFNNAALEQLTGALFSGGNLADDLQNGGLAVLGDSPADDELGYSLITTNQENTNLLFQSFVLDPETQEFVEVDDNSDDDELVLTTNGWIASPNDYFVTGLDRNSISVANSAGESAVVNGTLLNLNNLTLIEFGGLLLGLDEDSFIADGFWNWAFSVDSEFSFTEDAAVYLTSSTSLSESYYLWTTEECSDRLDGECWYTNVQNIDREDGAISSLDDMFVESEWDGTDATQLIAIHLAWGQVGVLIAEFVSSESTSGVVNFYIHNYFSNTVDKMGQGQWQRQVNHGVELVLLELNDPLLDAVEDFVYIDSTQLLFSVYGGYVRNGGYDLPGQPDYDDEELWLNLAALEQLENALVFEEFDSDDDGVNDSDDAFPNDPNESVDTDGDLIGNNADTDDDGDQYLDTDEIAAASDPLDGASLPLDTDGDYISDATDSDDDDDGVSDTDELALGSDPLDRNSVPQDLTLLTFDDVSGDGVVDWLGYAVKTSEVQVNVFSGDDFLSMGSFSFAHNFDAAQLHKLGDRDDDGVSEIGVFGFDSALNRYQLFVHNGISGQKLGTWNWPAILISGQLEVLPDLTDDGIQEYAVQGIHGTNGTRQLVVKNGMTRATYQTFKWPNLWDNTQIVSLSDRNGDNIPEIALYGRHIRIDKGQLFVFDGASATTKMDVYNWNKLWNDIQLIKMDDVDGEGTIDWGQFGKRKDDGRYQWVVKKGHDKRGVIRTFSWPGDLENVTPLLVGDRTNDGVREVAVVGTHAVNGRLFLRINDGKLANQRIANISWPANWEDVQVKELGDLNDDGFNEYAMLGYLKSNRKLQLVVKDGQTLTEYGRYTFEDDWETLLLSSNDVNGDGNDDVMVSGIEQATGLRRYIYLNGVNMELLWQR
jgi:hypothetical protein